MPARTISDIEKQTIHKLAAEGKSDAQIADILGWTHKGKVRSVAQIRRKDGPANQKFAVKMAATGQSLEQMSKAERITFLHQGFETNLRTKLTFENFSNNEKDLFRQEYFNALKSIESLTEAEEQQLFIAILEYVKAMRAMQVQSSEERLYAESMRGQIKKHITGLNGASEINPNWRATVDPRFAEEYDTHLKAYREIMDDLKLSRKQRLDKIKSDKKTLVEVAVELSNIDAQAQAAEDIERLSKETNETLQEMLKNGYLLGKFGESQ